MSKQTLEELYEATAEAFRYGVGQLALPDQPPAPLVQMYYADWSRQQLELVRTAFKSGVYLSVGRCVDQRSSLHIGTCQSITLQATDGAETSALRAPAWDAHLEGVAASVLRQFDADRQRYGGFVLLMQTANWEFLATVDDLRGKTHIGPVLPRSWLLPGG